MDAVAADIKYVAAAMPGCKIGELETGERDF